MSRAELEEGMSHEPGSELDRDLVEGVPTDAQIEVGVKDALAWEDRIDAGRIHVEVAAGEVTLSGRVDTLEQKELAETLAAAVRGVSEVRSRIEVAGHGTEEGAPQARG